MKINFYMLVITIVMVTASIQFLMQGNKAAAGMMFFVGIGNGFGAFL